MTDRRMISAHVARSHILRTSHIRFQRFVSAGAIRVTDDGMVDDATIREAYRQAVAVEAEFRIRVEALRDEENRQLALIGLSPATPSACRSSSASRTENKR